MTDDDARRLGSKDALFVVAFGPALGGALLFVGLWTAGGERVAELVRASSPFAPEDRAAIGMVAGTALLAGVFAAAAWRGLRGPVREVSNVRAALMALATFASAFFWLVIAVAVVAAD